MRAMTVPIYDSMLRLLCSFLDITFKEDIEKNQEYSLEITTVVSEL